MPCPSQWPRELCTPNTGWQVGWLQESGEGSCWSGILLFYSCPSRRKISGERRSSSVLKWGWWVRVWELWI